MDKLFGKSGFKRIVSVVNPPMAALYIIFGLILLIVPDVSNRIIGYTLAVVSIMLGSYYVVNYLKTDSIIAFHHQDLTLGLGLLALGIFMLYDPEAPGEFLGSLWGIALILGGLAKIQMSVDMLRMKKPDWWWSAIGAVIAILLGILALCNAVGVGETLIRFEGAALLVEGIMDIIFWVKLRKVRMALETASRPSVNGDA